MDIEFLHNSPILFDTCVVSKIYYNPFKPEIITFLQTLKTLKCRFCINDFIYLEFIRLAKTKTQKKQFDIYLKDIYFVLPVDSKLITAAKVVYSLFNLCNSLKNAKQVSLVDALNVAYLSRYQGLFFITLDNNDYPTEILDRIQVGCIDIGSEILTWGIYRFNTNKFQERLNIFSQI